MKNIGLESASLPPARLTGVCLGGQTEGFLSLLPLAALGLSVKASSEQQQSQEHGKDQGEGALCLFR